MEGVESPIDSSLELMSEVIAGLFSKVDFAFNKRGKHPIEGI
jgi:hypothetical protein